MASQAKVLADSGGIDADGGCVERTTGPGQLSGVGVKHRGELRGQDRGLRTAAAGR